MKNKLTKTGHKKLYYRFKNLALIATLAGAAIVAIVSPVMITYAVTQKEAAAEAASSTIEEQESIPLESYTETLFK